MAIKNSAFYVFFALVLGAVFLLVRLPEGDLAGYDDAIYAHMAKSMIQSGDWWSISFNGYFDPENPPMLIWLQAISMKIFGISDFAAKMPSALCGLAIIPLVYLIGRKIFADYWTPLAGTLIMLMTPYFLKYASHAMTDVPFMLFCTAAVWFYLCSIEKPIFMLMAGVFTAFAVLTRSVIGLMPILFYVAHLTASGRLRKRMVPLSACILIALAIPAVWFVSMGRLHPDFWSGHLGFILSKTQSSENSPGRWLLGLFKYPYLLLKNYWPWAPLAAIGVWKYARRLGKSDSAPLILILWVASVIVPLSFAGSKVLRYILPAFPAFSLLCAAVLAEWLPEPRKVPVLKWTFCGLAVIAAGFALLPVDAHKNRATEARSLVSILNHQIEGKERVLLYSRGVIRWDLRNQLVWYGHHPVDLVMRSDELRQGLTTGRARWAIVDNETYNSLPRELPSPARNIGHTSSFVCIAYAK